MNTTTQEEILQRKATLVRERLLAVVDELDRKRHDFAHVIAHPGQIVKDRLTQRLRPHRDTIAAAVGGTVLLAAGGIGYAIYRYRRDHTWSRRLLARIPEQKKKPTFWGEVFSRSAKALLAFGLVQGLKFAIREGAKRTGTRIPAQ